MTIQLHDRNKTCPAVSRWGWRAGERMCQVAQSNCPIKSSKMSLQNWPGDVVGLTGARELAQDPTAISAS